MHWPSWLWLLGPDRLLRSPVLEPIVPERQPPSTIEIAPPTVDFVFLQQYAVARSTFGPGRGLELRVQLVSRQTKVLPILMSMSAITPKPTQRCMPAKRRYRQRSSP